MIGRNWFEDDSMLHNLLYAELDEPKQGLFDRVHHIPYGCAILHFLSDHPRRQVVAGDIAFHIDVSPTIVQASLADLMELGLVEQARAQETTFFGLTSDVEKRRLVHDLFDWQRQWHLRLSRLENLIEGHSN